MDDLHFLNDSMGWVATGIIGGDDPLVKTTNGGDTWELIESVPFSASGYGAVYFINEQMGWVSGGR